MNLKHATRRSTTHWIDGIGISIASDGIARNVPAAIAEKLLANAELWSSTEDGGSVAPGTIVNAPAQPAPGPAPVLEVLVPESLALLEGLKIDEIVYLASAFEVGPLADVKQGARSILAAADVQLASQLARMLREKDAPVPAVEAEVPAAPVAEEPASEADVPAETAPGAPEGVLGASEADPDALDGVQVIEAGKGRGARKPGRR